VRTAPLSRVTHLFAPACRPDGPLVAASRRGPLQIPPPGPARSLHPEPRGSARVGAGPVQRRPTPAGRVTATVGRPGGVDG